MKTINYCLLALSSLLIGCVLTVNDRTLIGKGHVERWNSKLVIAHRGASGYLPEHTLAAKAMAYAQGADFIEQDLVMTKDDQVIVLHDHHLDTVTNVRDIFPDRGRSDGQFYVVDFTLAEIRQLAVSERFSEHGSMKQAVFEQRFPIEKSAFQINTFAEEIELIQGLNKSTGRNVGIYPEIKSPEFHRSEKKDISTAVLTILNRYGYKDKTDSVFLQCFDPSELQRIYDNLLPNFNMSIALVQLIGSEDVFRPLLTNEGLANVAKYSDGIGPPMSLLLNYDADSGKTTSNDIVDRAHSLGLVVHPYTVRRDQLPPFATSHDELLELLFESTNVDGVFTDFPDLAKSYIESQL